QRYQRARSSNEKPNATERFPCASTLPDFSQLQTQLKAFRTGGDGKIPCHYTIPALRIRLSSQQRHPSRLSTQRRKSAGTSLAPAEAERNTRNVAAGKKPSVPKSKNNDFVPSVPLW